MGKMTKAQRHAAAVKAAKTRKKNRGSGGSRRSSRGGFNCPHCGGKLPKSMLRHKKRKVNPAMRRKFINARNAAIKAGWSGVPGAKMSKQQRAAFSAAFH